MMPGLPAESLGAGQSIPSGARTSAAGAAAALGPPGGAAGVRGSVSGRGGRRDERRQRLRRRSRFGSGFVSSVPRFGVVATVVFAAAFTAWLALVVLSWASEFLAVTNVRLLTRRGVFNQEMSSLRLEHVTSLEMEHPLFLLALGAGLSGLAVGLGLLGRRARND